MKNKSSKPSRSFDYDSTSLARAELENRFLSEADSELIMTGSIDRLVEFAKSSRRNAVTHKGDSALHLVARSGSLAKCDLLIRLGANPKALNYKKETPSEVAHFEGNFHLAQLLSSYIKANLNSGLDLENDKEKDHKYSKSVVREVSLPEELTQSRTQDNLDFNDLLGDMFFEAELEPEEFFGDIKERFSAGEFTPFSRDSKYVLNDEEADWDIDIPLENSASSTLRDKPGSADYRYIADHEAKVSLSKDKKYEFLQVSNRGPKSARSAVVQPSTKMSIDRRVIEEWVIELNRKGRLNEEDIHYLIACCEGNGNFDELYVNLKRNLESWGLSCESQESDIHHELFETDLVSFEEELVEAIESVFSRSTALPGMVRFKMDRSIELQLLKPMLYARDELLLNILSSEWAVNYILEVLTAVCNGSREPKTVTNKHIVPLNSGHDETNNFLEAADDLRQWFYTLHVGRENLEVTEDVILALRTLNLTYGFQKELVRLLAAVNSDSAQQLDYLVEGFRSEQGVFVENHLSYVRRYSARNVREGEDPEEVFQVAVTGILKAVERFDPDREIRFVGYGAFWMRQSLDRWRLVEGSAIRIPVHQHEYLARLEQAHVDVPNTIYMQASDSDIAAYLGWKIEEVDKYQCIPKFPEYPENSDAWDDVFSESESEDIFDRMEANKVLNGVLDELKEREQTIIRMRFGIGYDDEMTLEDIGKVFGLTRERIRQIESKGLKYLSNPNRILRLQKMLGI